MLVKLLKVIQWGGSCRSDRLLLCRVVYNHTKKTDRQIMLTVIFSLCVPSGKFPRSDVYSNGEGGGGGSWTEEAR